jgi:hypothetical protein
MNALILILLAAPGLLLLIGTVAYIAFSGGESKNSENDRK